MDVISVAGLLASTVALILAVVLYGRASGRLRDEAARLRGLVNTLAHYLHDEGAIRAEFDHEGNLIWVTRLQDEFTLQQEKAEVTETPSEG